MANTKLQIEVQVDSAGAIKGLQIVQGGVKGIADEVKKIGGQGFEGFASQVKSAISDPLAAAGDAAKGLLTTLGPVGSGVAAAGAVFVALAAAGYESAKSLGALGDRIADTGVRMGLTTKEVGQFNFAMKLAGSEGIGALEPSMRKLSQGLSEGSEEGRKAREALRDLGVTTRTAAGDLRPMSEIFIEISQRLNGVGDTAKRNALAIQVLGRAGLEVLPDLLELSAGVQRAKELGLGPSQEDVDRWNKYQKQIAEVDEKWEILKRKLKEPLAAAISFVIKWSNSQDSEAFSQAKSRFSFGYSAGAYRDDDFEHALMAGLGRFQPTAGGAQSVMAQANALATQSTAQERVLQSGLDRTLEGAQTNLERLKQKYDEARTKAESLVASHNVLPGILAQSRKEIEGARAAYEAQKLVVAAISELEAKRVEIAKQQRDLRGQGQGYYTIGTGALQTVVSAQDITAANPITRRPSLRRNGEVRPEDADAALADLAEGRLAGGTFVSPSASRSTSSVTLNANGEATASDQRALGAGLIQSQQAADAAHLTSLHIETDLVTRLVELRAGPNGEIVAAQRVAGIRRDAIEEELQVTGDIDKAREDSLRNEAELRLRLAEIDQRRADQIRSTVEGLLHTAATDPRQFGQQLRTTVTDSVLKPLETGLATQITKVIQPIIYGENGKGGINGALGGIFGSNKNPLQVATDANTLATQANTQAMAAWSASFGGAPVSGGLFGGGSIGGGIFSDVPGGIGSLPADVGALGRGGASNPLGALARTAGGVLNGAASLARGGNVWKAITGGDYSMQGADGVTTTASSQGLTSGAGRAGAIIGAGGAIFAGVEGVLGGIKQGGAKGALGVVGSVAGTAAALDPEPISKAVLAGVALGSQVVSAILGDPKKTRSNAIDLEMRNAYRDMPTAQQYIMDTHGSAVDYNDRGTARPSVVNNWNVSTMDSLSFQGFLSKQGTVVAGVVNDQLGSHGPLQQNIKALANPS